MYTDAARAYQGLHRRQEAVTHTVGAYVREQAHPHGPESFRTGWKRGQDGVYLHFSTKHLDRYVDACEGWHNACPMDTATLLAGMVRRSVGKRLPYAVWPDG